MRVFVTGATGYIGGTVAQCLLEAGHHIIGLVRPSGSVDEKSDQLRAAGIEPYIGDLDDPESLKEGVTRAEAVIHAGFSLTDYSKLDEAFAKEGAAVQAMLSALAGTGHPFIYTSGAGVFDDTGDRIVDETVPADATGDVGLRRAIEQTVLEAADQNVRSMIIRPGLVYGKGGSGVMHLFAGLAGQTGGGRTVGDGDNVWPAVHVEDLADLYVAAIERGPAGTIFHAGTEDEVPMRDIAAAVGNALGLEGPVTAWPVDEARAALGLLADGLTTNKRISSARARELLGWNPHRPGVVEETERGSYPAAFAAAAAAQG